jgi:hypothetical protein
MFAPPVPALLEMVTVPELPAACDANWTVPEAFEKAMLRVSVLMRFVPVPSVTKLAEPGFRVLECPTFNVVAVIEFAVLLKAKMP